ncbi:hypothetical protein ERJ75_001057200 [Trypanosoma vivax]|nr:hypothetical protein TRVL_06774 [Trypanosoma vivax]KAH8610779.1 hypothetical protein ERJ75_001057200 [Trypanosoma vivax]
MYHLAGKGALLPPPAKRRYVEPSQTIRRNRVCPAAIRGYWFRSNDIATHSEICSAVLQTPPSGISNPTGLPAEGPETTIKPTVVFTIWNDTTCAEVASVIMERVRREVDSAFSDRLAQERVEKELVRGGESGTYVSVSEGAIATYIVKLSMGYVGAGGGAILYPLATVELRQVVKGEPFLFPVRRASAVDVDVPLTDLFYRLGDPLFFTCARVR